MTSDKFLNKQTKKDDIKGPKKKRNNKIDVMNFKTKAAPWKETTLILQNDVEHMEKLY